MSNQSLEEHIVFVIKKVESFKRLIENSLSFQRLYFNSVILHDLGKLSNDFQSILRNKIIPTGIDLSFDVMESNIEIIDSQKQRPGRVNRNFNKYDSIVNRVNLLTDNTELTQFIPHQIVFKYLIPTKRREEVLGDLIETKIMMMEDGLSLWKIRFILYFHMFMIVVSMLRMTISDYGRSKKKIN